MRPSSAPLGQSRFTSRNNRRRLGTSPIRTFKSRPETAGNISRLRKRPRPIKRTSTTNATTTTTTTKAYLATLLKFANDPNLVDTASYNKCENHSYQAVAPSQSHPILDNLNTRLGLREVDLLLRNRGVRPTSAAALRRRAPRGNNRPSTASPALLSKSNSITGKSTSTLSPPSGGRTRKKRPNTAKASYNSSFNTDKAYNWRYPKLDDVSCAQLNSHENSVAQMPQGSSRSAGKWRRFQRLQAEVFYAQNKRAADRVEECRRAKSNMWSALDKIRHIMERDAKTREQKRKQVHKMFVACAAGFGATEAPLVTLPQFLSRFCTFGFNWWEIEAPLKRAFVALDADLDNLVDWRDIIIALRIAVHPLEPPPDRLRRFFNLYSDDSNYMNRSTLIHMMTVTLYATESVDRVAGAMDVWLNSGDIPMPGLYMDHFMSLVEHEWRIAEEEWMTVGPVKAVVNIDSFLLVMWHDWFQGMSPEMRLRVADDRQQMSLKIIEETETRCSIRKAVKMWQMKTLRKVWHQFSYGCHLSYCDKMSAWHDTYRSRKRGVLRWRLYANASARLDAMTNSAQAFRERWLKKTHFTGWRHYWLRCSIRKRRMFEQAQRWWRSIILERSFNSLKNYWLKRLKKYEAIAFWHTLEKRNLFRTWKKNVQYSINTRKAADTLGAIRTDVFFGKADAIDQDVEDYKASVIAEYERKREEENQRKLAKRAAEDLWSEQKIAAYVKGQDRRKKKMQDEEWKTIRQNKEKRDRRKEDLMWEKMHRHIAEDAEFEAYAFLRTQNGKELLATRIKQVQKEGGLREDQVANGLDFELKEDATAKEKEEYNAKVLIEAMTSAAEFVKLFDPLLNESFFYNCKTGDRLTAEDLSYEEAEAIAIEVYIKEQVSKAYQNARAATIKDKRDRLENASATKINNFMRANYYKKYMRKMFLKVFSIKMDQTTGEPYFLNTETGQSQWTKPLALKSIKMNFPEWVLMRDPSGIPFYRQTIKPYDSSWEKPPHWLVCTTCRVDFPVRRCLDCKTVQCIDCYISTHPNPSFVEGADREMFEHKFEKLSVIQSYCTMCKSKLATKLCVECGAEQYCNKCFAMMHGKSRRKKNSLSSHVDIIEI
jgi:hypothetical protein